MLRLFFVCLLLPLFALAENAQLNSLNVVAEVPQPRLVLVIDDMGDNRKAGLEALKLQGPVTYAFLPHSPFGAELAELAQQRGKEVILHAPMANTHNRALGPGALTTSMSQQEFKKTLRAGLDSIPHVIGFNNHMGSLLTQNQQMMGWAMDVAEERQLFFLDSRTTAKTVAWRTARNAGVPWLLRDVFLDHERTTDFVDHQFLKALAVARRYGTAVVIGHPYEVTVDYLKAALPALDEAGVQLVSASALLLQQQHKAKLESYQKQMQQRYQRYWVFADCGEPHQSVDCGDGIAAGSKP